MSDPNIIVHETPLVRPIAESMAQERREAGLARRGQGGKFLKRDEQEEFARPEPDVAPEGFVPVRVWTAGPGTPQEKIVIPGTSKGVRPGPDGAYHCRTPLELDAVKRGLGPGRYWPDNIAADEPSLKCQTCMWTCRNYHAMSWHQNNAHGRPQTD